MSIKLSTCKQNKKDHIVAIIKNAWSQKKVNKYILKHYYNLMWLFDKQSFGFGRVYQYNRSSWSKIRASNYKSWWHSCIHKVKHYFKIFLIIWCLFYMKSLVAMKPHLFQTSSICVNKAIISYILCLFCSRWRTKLIRFFIFFIRATEESINVGCSVLTGTFAILKQLRFTPTYPLLQKSELLKYIKSTC